MSIRKLSFISLCMVLMAAIVACGGDDEGYSFPCGSSQCQSITVSAGGAEQTVLHDTSVTRSQADRLATTIFEAKKEAGSTSEMSYVLNIQDGNFVVQGYYFTGLDKPKVQAIWDELACRWSTEAFDGLQVRTILHAVTGDTASDQDFADYALSHGQEPPYLVASCGNGLAKKEDVKPAPKQAKEEDKPASASDGESTPKATSTPKIKNYSGCKGLEDLIPKLSMPGSVALSYYQVVQLGIDKSCDEVIEAVNKPENLKD